MTRAITITSGKGGVGKTNISLNIALQLASLGHKICLFDADLGLANINILLGIRPTYDINDLVQGKQRLADVLISAQGIDILPGSSGVEELANLQPDKLATLLKELTLLASYDYLFFDTSAGIAKNVIAFCLSCPETLVVITPEPTSLTDAYALLKVLAANDYKGSIKVVINQCPDMQTAKKVYKRFKDAVDQFIGLPMEALGVVYKDSKVTEAVGRQIPFLKLFPESIASKCIRKITERLLANQPEKFDQKITNFWEKCLNFMSIPLELSGPKTPTPEIVPIAEAGMDTIHGPTSKLTSENPVQKELIPIDTGIEQSLAVLARSIAGGIESIAKELKEIRQELLNNRRNISPGAADTGQGKLPEQPETKPIALDIDRYLKDKGHSLAK
jgi:flagellar biosynthesis protein FlhG